MSLALPIQSFAQEKNQPKSHEGLYLGSTVGFTGSSSVSENDSSVNELLDSDLELSTGLYAGYEFNILENFNVAAEFDLYFWGNYEDVSRLPAEAHVLSTTLNIKPKYYFTENLFVGGSLGYGQHKFTYDNYSIFADTGFSFKENGLTYGIEAGYQHTKGVMVSLGYRAANFKYQNATFNLASTYIGLGYKF
ncbi:putative OMPA-like protein [Vibrio nigripulchritudo]|uniref:Putative OMPA-like protein n=2 Tax=Vibrio nigripulchritudo TaxID=28173 RepID=U4K231_9VIBR|nr:putative OMPA-like protein [Vibrio nigripulchritudo]